MTQLRSILILLGALLISILVVIGLFRTNYDYVVQNPGGNDFLVHWVGARAFIIEGVSPYDDSVALEIQERAYGRPARPGEHELRVAYPLYSTLIFAPFALVSDYPLARAIWMTALEVAVLLTAFICVRLTEWRPGLVLLAAYLLFAMLWYHSVRPLINGNAVLLVTLLVCAALYAIKRDRDELAGALLALATIKPQVVVLLILFVLVWAFSRRRWLLIGWLVGGVLALTVSMMLIVPDWLLQNLREVLRYPAYNPPGTPGAALAVWMPALGPRLGLALTLILVAILVVEWRAAWRQDFRWFLWTACLTLVVSAWIGIQTDPGNFIALLPALTLIFAVWQERWGLGGQISAAFAMVILFFGIWWLFLGTLDFGDQPQQHPIMFFPLPLFLLIGLYWVRWTAVEPLRLWVDEIRRKERGVI